jgi:tetratricopeptide (TPR) repeat protein
VSTLSAPTRAMAYLAGFGGGRARGLALLESAAAHPSDAQTEAKLGLVLLYNREARYDDALRVLADLRTRYPRNRLLWLESAATARRGRRAQDAKALLAEAERQFAGDTRRRAFGEAALWHYTRGIVRLEMGDLSGARDSLLQALTGDARTWVRARTHLALGKMSEHAGDRAAAAPAYDTAARLGDVGRDPVTAAEARRLRARLPAR